MTLWRPSLSRRRKWSRMRISTRAWWWNRFLLLRMDREKEGNQSKAAGSCNGQNSSFNHKRKNKRDTRLTTTFFQIIISYIRHGHQCQHGSETGHQQQGYDFHWNVARLVRHRWSRAHLHIASPLFVWTWSKRESRGENQAQLNSTKKWAERCCDPRRWLRQKRRVERERARRASPQYNSNLRVYLLLAHGVISLANLVCTSINDILAINVRLVLLCPYLF